MTLRGVIQGLLRGSDDAEAMLTQDGYGDLPAEMFSQALASYADTAPMAEADALSPVLTTIDAGNASDVFAVLEEQPPTIGLTGGPEVVGLGAAVLGLDTVDDALDDDSIDDALDDFGSAAPEEASDTNDITEDDSPAVEENFEESSVETSDVDDPFGHGEPFDAPTAVDSAGEFEELDDFFDTEPVATGEDPSDLDF